MSFLNDTSLIPASFILKGIPGLEEVHLWISFPLCTMYSIAITGNFGLMYLIYSEKALHRPMYIFLALLSFTDVLMCTSTPPHTLCISIARRLIFNACLSQMFFVHMLTGMESGVLMLMALDRYVAIYYSLSYVTILTNSVIAEAGLNIFLKGVMLAMPFTFLTKRLPYC
nr:olfactory receptor 52N1-like [Loxodonta africana]